jgi:hypothetical protein
MRHADVWGPVLPRQVRVFVFGRRWPTAATRESRTVGLDRSGTGRGAALFPHAEALFGADRFEDWPGRWQATILKAERDRLKLRLVSHDDGAELADSHGDLMVRPVGPGRYVPPL